MAYTPNTRLLSRSFNGGELTPEMFGRIDDQKFSNGLATMRNFIALPHGPAANRPGFEFVRAVKNSAQRTRLIPFTFSVDQTFAIEMGAGYFRFHTQGKTLLTADGSAPYEVASDYAEADLFDIHYVQSADVLTLVHPKYPPRELSRHGANDWRLTAISFAAQIAAPTGVTGSAQNVPSEGNKYTSQYCVTAIKDNPTQESIKSAVVSVQNNLLATGATNTVSWQAVSGAARYAVYKYSGGLFGYLGQTDTLSLIDDNITPDVSKTPPVYDATIGTASNYPGAVTYFEQRRCFAGTINKPQNLWMTKSGTESDLSYSLPVRDDDRVAVRVAAREANVIRHLVPMGNLLLLTSSAEWRATSADGGAITPSSIGIRPQSYIGANNVQPVIINSNLVYCASRGGHVREMSYSNEAAGYITGDLSLRAPHLFDNLNLMDMAYAKAPSPIVWFVSSNGKLLGLTYVPEQQVGSWHWHDTLNGQFESCTVVAEGNEDVLYVIVRRLIAGSYVRYVERMETRQFVAQADAFFVDSGVRYKGDPVTTISGLGHLNGCVVNVLADGAVHPKCTVENGSIELEQPCSTVVIGLPITADLHTLPIAAGIDTGYGQGRPKNVNKVWVRVYRSSGIWIGPDADHLREIKQRTTEDYGTPPKLKSDELELVLDNSWGQSGDVLLRQSDPLPLTLVSMTMEIAIGG